MSPSPAPRVCRACGCTDHRACIAAVRPLVPHMLLGHRQPARVMTCCWVEDDLCSACVEPPGPGSVQWIHPNHPRYEQAVEKFRERAAEASG